MKFFSIYILLFLISCAKTNESNQLVKEDKPILNNNIEKNINIPKCNDDIIKEKVINLYKKQAYDELLYNYVSENYNFEDIRLYAQDNGLNINQYANEQKNKIREEGNKFVHEILNTSVIKNIRTNEENEKLKKCDCSAEIVSDGEVNYNINYTAQKTEDTGEIYVDAYLTKNNYK